MEEDDMIEVECQGVQCPLPSVWNLVLICEGEERLLGGRVIEGHWKPIVTRIEIYYNDRSIAGELSFYCLTQGTLPTDITQIYLFKSSIQQIPLVITIIIIHHCRHCRHCRRHRYLHRYPLRAFIENTVSICKIYWAYDLRPSWLPSLEYW